MKKFATLALIVTVAALTGCAGSKRNADYGYETNAPYGSERTVGAQKKATKVYKASQSK